MNIFARIKCAIGRHQWKRYSRWNGVRCDDGEKVQQPRRVCVHCGKRETVFEQEEPRILSATVKGEGTSLTPEHIDAARRLLEKQKIEHGPITIVPAPTVSPYIPPEGVSNESGPPETVIDEPGR